MMNVFTILLLSSTLIACSGGGGGGFRVSSPSTSPAAIVPSDEFTASTFDSTRWLLSYSNSTTPIVKSALGIKIGSNDQNQTDSLTYFATSKYKTHTTNVNSDVIVGELTFNMLNTTHNEVSVAVEFANGKRMIAMIYGEYDNNGFTQYYGVVKVTATDGVTVIYDTTATRIHLASALNCMQFKIAPNYNASSTAQWNVDFTANCMSTSYATTTALDAASLGATDYVGNNNGDAKYSLIGRRDNTQNLDSFYVELLNWNFSNLGATVIAL